MLQSLRLPLGYQVTPRTVNICPEPGTPRVHLARHTSKLDFFFFLRLYTWQLCCTHTSHILKVVAKKPRDCSSPPGTAGTGGQEPHLAPAQLQRRAAPVRLDTDVCARSLAKNKINVLCKELKCQR